MPATVTSIAPKRSAGPPPRRTSARRPFRDNPRLILAGIVALVAVLIAILAIANRTPRLAPDFLSEVVLYALSAADLTMLAALVFVLARNIIKLIVERRRALPFARFRAKLVAVLLGMTIVPAVLVLDRRQRADSRRASINWFNAPMDDILSSANKIAGDYYHERQALVSDHASRLARALSAVDLGGGRCAADSRSGRARRHAAARQDGAGLRVGPAGDGVPRVEPVVDVVATEMPTGYNRASAERLAVQALTGRADTRSVETLGSSGDLLHAAAVIKSKDGTPTGVVVATDYLTGDLAARSRSMTQAYENYNQLRVLKRPLTGVYLSFFLMVTLLILVGSTWMGLYLDQADHRGRCRCWPRRRARSAPAGSISASSLRATTSSDRSSRRSTRWPASWPPAAARSIARRSSSSASTRRCEGRRRYIETILERITTGVVSVDASGAITTINSAAARLLSLNRSSVGQPARAAFDAARSAADCDAARRRRAGAVASRRLRRSPSRATARSSTSPSPRRRWSARSGASEGAVLVLDDVTPLIRAQKVAAWREVARRLAHEIKNPLTPIQLCAERLRRHFAGASPAAKALVDECTTTIVGEVESLKGLVDEFSQFARMPAPRTVPTDLAQLITETLALYNGLFAEVRIEQPLRRRSAAGAPRRRTDPARHHQPRRQRDRGDGTARRDRRRDAAGSRQQRRARRRRRRWPGDSARRAREAVPAVLLDQAARQRPRVWRSSAASSPSTAAASR